MEECTATKSAVVASTMAANSRTRTQEPVSGESAPEQQAVSAADHIPQYVEDHAGDDECEESPLDDTLTPECEPDSSPCKKSPPESPNVCDSANYNSCESEDEKNQSCSHVALSLPTNANQNKQSEESHEAGQHSEAGSEATLHDATHKAQCHETSAVGSERRILRAVRRIRKTKSSSSSSSSVRSRSSESRGADSGGSLSCGYLGSGTEGDNDDTDTTRSRTSSDDLIELYDYAEEFLEMIKKHEAYLMGAIGSCMEQVSSTSSEIRGFALDLFGEQRPTGDTSQKSFSGRRKGEAVVEEEEACRPNVDFERRLEAIKAYVSCGSNEPEVMPETKAETEERESTLSAPEKGACSATPSNESQETEISSSGANVMCGENVAAPVDSGNDEGRDGEADASEQHSYDRSVRNNRTTRKIVKICDIVEQRVLKVKVSCEMMLSCMKSVADVVNLAMEAYRVTELVLQKAKTCRSKVARDVLQEITAAATDTSVWMWKALIDAETAVRIHKGFIEDIEKAEESLYGVRLEGPVDDGVMRDVTAAVDDMELLVQRTAIFRLGAAQGDDEGAGARACVTPPPSSDDVEASVFREIKDGSGRVPTDVLEALLAATKSSLHAVQTTARALEFFSTCELCVVGKTRKPHGYNNKITKDAS